MGDATLLDVLADFETNGFIGQFTADRDGHLRCLTCKQLTHADEVLFHDLVRLEGASDPSDMAAVAALACPRCRTRGTVVLRYGPEATPEEADVLRLLEKAEHAGS